MCVCVCVCVCVCLCVCRIIYIIYAYKIRNCETTIQHQTKYFKIFHPLQIQVVSNRFGNVYSSLVFAETLCWKIYISYENIIDIFRFLWSMAYKSLWVIYCQIHPWRIAVVVILWGGDKEAIGFTSWVFANGSVDRSSILGRIIPKTQKWYLINTQHYKVRIKSNVE